MKRRRGRSRSGSGRQRVPAWVARFRRRGWRAASSSSSATAWGWAPWPRRGFFRVSVAGIRARRRSSRGTTFQRWRWREWVQKMWKKNADFLPSLFREERARNATRETWRFTCIKFTINLNRVANFSVRFAHVRSTFYRYAELAINSKLTCVARITKKLATFVK